MKKGLNHGLKGLQDDTEGIEGYKKTEVGVIPSDWELKRLKTVIYLKNGFAFKSEYFSENGSIILTPGNFKLEGGLYFNEKNTKRYSANFPSEFKLNYGDLVIVMTDLTKECNLLGKPAFVKHQEELLHNQRIGKVEILNNKVSKNFLFYFFLSNKYHSKIKETATGSTVRHTSPTSIYAISIPLPPTIEEQKTIAQSLSDVDALITECDRIITKKRNTKQGTMQQLLTGKKQLPGFSGEWEVKRLGDILDYIKGFAFKSKDYRSDGVRIIRVSDTTYDSIKEENQIYIENSKINLYSNWKLEENDLILSTVGSKPPMYDSMVGKVIFIKKKYEGCLLNQNAVLIRSKDKNIDKQRLIYYHLKTKRYLRYIEVIFRGNANQASITLADLFEFAIPLPSVQEEQIAIAQILSDMDTEITALEQKRDKYKAIKQGMMQELLTGKTRIKYDLEN